MNLIESCMAAAKAKTARGLPRHRRRAIHAAQRLARQGWAAAAARQSFRTAPPVANNAASSLATVPVVDPAARLDAYVAALLRRRRPAAAEGASAQMRDPRGSAR